MHGYLDDAQGRLMAGGACGPYGMGGACGPYGIGGVGGPYGGMLSGYGGIGRPYGALGGMYGGGGMYGKVLVSTFSLRRSHFIKELVILAWD
jgi:hypothetical protein